jgi:hypothetical protein
MHPPPPSDRMWQPSEADTLGGEWGRGYRTRSPPRTPRGPSAGHIRQVAGLDAATPDHAVRRDNRTVGQHHVVVRDPCHRGAKADLDSVAEQDLPRVPVGLGRERAEDGVAEVDKDDAGLLEREVRSLPCSSRSVSRSSSSFRASSCCTCWTNDPFFLGRALRIPQGWREA